MEEKQTLTEQWLERSAYDLSAAASLLKSGHFLYVAFLCQQASEKMLKGMWCALRKDSPPYSHNLSTLALSLDLSLSEIQFSLLDRLNSYYIVGRYPSFKQKLASEIDKKAASFLLQQTEEFLQWCRKYIKM